MSNPPEVYCCSASEDQERLRLLTKYLTPLQKVGRITVWSYLNLSPFVKWEKELRHFF
jgi:hypothetical protein